MVFLVDWLKKNWFAFLFVVTIATTYVDRFFEVCQQQHFLLLCWVGVSIVYFIKNKPDVSRDFFQMSILILLPKLVMFIYSFLLFVFNVSNPEYFSTNITVLAPTLGIIATVLLFKKDSLKYISYAFLLSFILVFAYNIFHFGFIKTFQAFFVNQITTGVVSEWSPFEVHDLTFAAGYFFIFYLFTFSKKQSQSDYKTCIIMLVVSILFMYLGFKRIQLLALLAVLFVWYLIKHIPSKYQVKVIYGILGAIFISSIIYVILLINGTFFTILESLNVDTMGRVYYFDFIRKLCTLSPSFLGIGLNNVSKYMLDVYDYLGVGGVHNDILKMYAELGFVMFLLWLVYYLFVIPRFIHKKFDKKCLVLILLFTVYNFVLYTTDNVENYYISSFLYIFIPFWYTLYHNRNKVKDGTSKNEE